MTSQSKPQRNALDHGPINSASQQWFQATISDLIPGHPSALLALFVYLEGAGRHADALVSRVVHERGLDGSQMTVLFTLWFARPTHRLSPTQLHRMLVQSPSGVTHTVRRLTRSGLTRRVRDSADGRSWYVELTPEGQETAETATKELVNALDAIFGSMGPAQLQTLTDAQRLITETLAASPLAYPTSSRPLAVGDSTDV